MKHPNIELRQIASLSAYDRNARTHSKEQIQQIAKSIERFGFTNPVLISDDHEIIAGHGRVEAAKSLGISSVPAIKLSHLNEEERRAYVLADNKLAENAGWDQELLAIELQGLIDLEFDIELTGFSTTEIDLILDEAAIQAVAADERLDAVPDLVEGPSVTEKGDLWILGRHRLLCGDARSSQDVETLMNGTEAGLLFTDPPYNVKIDGHVTGKGKHRHREFEMASGELSKEAFTYFLEETLMNASRSLRDGAIAYVYMDWRHMEEVLIAGNAVFDEFKNLCVWNKTNGGMGTFYRSKHELVFVFKKGSAPHINNFGLGDGGRYRTNVWDYAGISSLSTTRDEELAMHPTVKPVAMIADAIKDCSRRNDTILDLFGGSGSTLIAAEQTGRCACLMELDPAYCDTIIRRYEKVTGGKARLAQTGQRFEEVATNKSQASTLQAVETAQATSEHHGTKGTGQ